MGWFGDWIAGMGASLASNPSSAPRAMSGDGGVLITTPDQLEAALRSGNQSASGQSVSTESAMRVAAVYACVRIIATTSSIFPRQVKRRVDARTREDASDHSLWEVINRKPNAWQKPAQFVQMMAAHVLLRGNAYAKISRGVGGKVIALTPLHPDRVEVRQRKDLTKEFLWTRKDGCQMLFPQDEVMHLFGLSLDGVRGLSPISYAREAIGLSLAMEQHGGATFRNGANVSGALKMPAGRTLTDEQIDRLRADFDDYRSGGNKEGRSIILEDGLEYQQMALSAEDAQWIEARKFSRSDIAMFYGVPPHMIGDTEKSTSWGTGIEAQTQGFVTFTMEPHLMMWEEGFNGDCLDPVRDKGVFVRLNRNAIVRGDITVRWASYVQAMQWGALSPNEVREMEDQNPREGGDIYYPPPNMTAAIGGKDNVPA